MKTNMQMMVDRTAKLDELQGQSGALQSTSTQFQKQANTLRSEMAFRKLKIYFLGFIAFVVTIWIILIAVLYKESLVCLYISIVCIVLILLALCCLYRKRRTITEQEALNRSQT